MAQRKESQTMFAKSPPLMIPGTEGGGQDESEQVSAERTPLQPATNAKVVRYGSFVGTPPADESPNPMGSLELPGPALTPATSRRQKPPTPKPKTPQRTHSGMSGGPTSSRLSHNEIDVSPSSSPHAAVQPGNFSKRLFQRNQQKGTQHSKHHTFSGSRLKKMFKPHQLKSPSTDDVQLEAYEKLDAAQDDFFHFLDTELEKVEGFYKDKEDQSTERLQDLRAQLHELRDRRLRELREASNKDQVEGEDEGALGAGLSQLASQNGVPKENGHHATVARALKPIDNMFQGKHKVGRVTKSLQQNTSPQAPSARPDESRQDYVRKQDEAPSYRVAKRNLKLAMQEYYRGLELLKSYALLNRTAFRKINKKYDKSVKARPTMRYYSEKIEHAYFVKSDVLGGHLVAVEDLYSRYFEKGNHKVAAAKLRSKKARSDLSPSAFRNGFFLAFGLCFGISGLIRAFDRLLNSDSTIHTQTSYLLQLYAGYFLANTLFLMFVANCKAWTANRVNYTFVFEYDQRHVLDWRQLAELPCFFFALNSLILWIDFIVGPSSSFWLYWPIILIAVTLIIMALPFRIFYYTSRRWWGYSNWRLLWAGFYPVEFRDFYLGDMYCSSTYTMSQIELFFCLYANDWKTPGQCNSTHSRLLGFFTTLPAIWRALQCLRRYYDSRNWFPHLANCAKYGGNILYYMSLSLYRIHRGPNTKGAFIAFAIINGVYCAVWDVFMDWSLGDWWSENWLLRDRLAFKRKSIYYVAVAVDVVLRQQWIVYVVYVEDLQHSSIANFSVAFAEVMRRGMWSLFRVENEHCNNVGTLRATRIIPLPYKVSGESTPRPSHDQGAGSDAATTATGADIERQHISDSSVRRRKEDGPTPTVRALQRVGTLIAGAHAQDFEKKRKPPDGSKEEMESLKNQQDSSDSDGDDDEDSVQEREDTADIQRVRQATGRD